MVGRQFVDAIRGFCLRVDIRIGAAHEPEHRRHAPLRTERAEILARRRGAGFVDTPGRKVLAEGFRDALARGGIVDGKRVAVQRRDLRFPRCTRRFGFGIDDALDRGQHALAHALVEGAHVELDDGFVRDHVFLGAGLQRTDRDHGGFRRRHFARHDRLQPQHDRRGHHHRIDAGLRHRTVRTTPEQADLQAVGRGRDRAGASAQHAGRSDHHMLAEDDVRFRKTLEQAVVDHRLRTRRGFFRGLEHHHQGAVPGIARVRHQGAGAREPGDVHVVAAGVHYRHGPAFGIVRRDLAGIRHPGGFLDRQRVHVGAQHHGRTIAVAQQPDDTGVADVFRHFKAGRAQPVRGEARGAGFLHRQLGVRVHILVQGLEAGNQRIEIPQDRIPQCRSAHVFCPRSCWIDRHLHSDAVNSGRSRAANRPETLLPSVGGGATFATVAASAPGPCVEWLRDHGRLGRGHAAWRCWTVPSSTCLPGHGVRTRNRRQAGRSHVYGRWMQPKSSLRRQPAAHVFGVERTG